jgi:hypothetical protein
MYIYFSLNLIYKRLEEVSEKKKLMHLRLMTCVGAFSASITPPQMLSVVISAQSALSSGAHGLAL